jgi:predicted kinase
MLLGYPGAGKTTTAKIIEQLTGAKRLSSDEERLKRFPYPEFTPHEHDSLYRQLDEETAQLLSSGKSVIYDANLNRYTHRSDKYRICGQTNAKPILVWLNTPRDLSEQRAIEEQRQELWPKGETPQDMFTRIANLIEIPRENENPIILDGSSINTEIVKTALISRNLI